MRWLVVVLLIALSVSLYFNFLYKTERIVQCDTIRLVDTITIVKPIPVESTIVRYVKVKVSAEAEPKCDTILRIDTLKDSVFIPIEQKHYKSERYEAWVSGFQPVLDSFRLYDRQTIITQEKRLKIGLQGGVGMTPKGVQPYIGVGISINLFGGLKK